MRISAGKYKGRPIATTSGPGYRPATSKTRQAVFNMLVARGWIAEQGRVADLFAGSGSLGFEALSRGAGHVLFVEQDRRAADFIRRAAESLHLAPGIARVVTANVLTVLPKGPPGGPFDLIFADPPYGQDLLPPTVATLRRYGWLAPGGFLLAEVEAAPEKEKLLRAFDADSVEDLELQVDRTYGQTRIILWRSNGPA